MALGTITINPVNQFTTAVEVFGGLKVTNTDVVCDGAYPTGGTAITAAQLGMPTAVVFAITSVKVVASNGPSEAYYDKSTGKLLCYTGTAQVGNGTDLSGATVQITAFGY